MTRVALLKGGRSLERQISLRSGAQVHDALERLGHDVVDIDVGPDLVERLAEEKDAALKLRFRLVTGQLDNHAELKRVRKEIARINTEIRARQIAAAEGTR